MPMLNVLVAAVVCLALGVACVAGEKPGGELARLQQEGFPFVDLHAHLKGGLSIDDVLALSARNGVKYGIAPNCGVGFPITDDAGIYEFLEQMKGKPVYLGMQAEGREWVTMFSREAIAKFDYVFTDAMTFTDHEGRRVRIWIAEEVRIGDKQAWVDMYVDRIVGVMAEPIDIYVNATYLPRAIAGEYDQLWTEARMKRVIDAAVKNDVAIEINAKMRIPNAAFIKMAKSAGVKFTFGTNNGGRDDIGNYDYCVRMIRECGITKEDLFLPRPEGQKAIQRK
jgi:hypothetical protein